MTHGVANQPAKVDQYRSRFEDKTRTLYSPAKHSRNTVGAVVRFQAQGLLTGCVPHTHHKHKTWVDDGLNKAEEETVDSDASEVVACRRGHEQATPYCS